MINNEKEILAELKDVLPNQDIIEARECISHNEHGIALELICTQIIEHEIKIPKKLFDKIRSATALMDMDKGLYRQIEVDNHLE